MSNRWVVNTSPVILLAKVGRIDLLSKLTKQLVVPVSVADEINQGPAIDPARQWMTGEASQWITADPQQSDHVSAWDLGRGESAVLSWVIQNGGFEAIIDDRSARKCAGVLGIPFRGTLGVILAARQRNLVPAAEPIFGDLIRAGLLIDPKVLKGALRLIGE